jgi:hypothetical protein
MSVAAANLIFVCALFLVQGGMCHNTHNNGIFIILTHGFNYEIYVLPDDDTQCAIETCGSGESVLI